MAALAAGNVDIAIEGTERKDEIGVISRALCVLRDAVRKNNELVAEIRARDDREAAPRSRGGDPRQGAKIFARSSSSSDIAPRTDDEAHGGRPPGA